ncbi:hypothetical protein FRC17_002216 [Serendipita sp. 399]|nr:hypothetical protein FRC17_002216 [Serendipita sp. 399]
MHLLDLFVAMLGFGVGFAHAKGCGASDKKAVTAFRFRYSLSTSTIDSATVSSWSEGGGKRGKIPTDTADTLHPFYWREYAGGGRWEILGTRAYGSGYPYGVQDVSTVKGRPFPHGMWPISWGPGYLGGDEYWGKDLDLIRPGGVVGILNVSTKDTTKWPGVSSDEVYTMIGDKESLAFMIGDLVRICHASPASPRKFNPVSPSSSSSHQPKPENVIQYYRSSSFALAYAGYNNTFALPSSRPTTNHDSLPLPGNIVNSAFLHCVNDTIRASLPLTDRLPGSPRKLSTGELIGISWGAFIGAVFIVVVCYLIYDKCKSSRSKETEMETEQAADDEGVQNGAETDVPLLKGDSPNDAETAKMDENDQTSQVKDGESTQANGEKENRKVSENVLYL